jgi:glyoxylase-like metal-dependent hydrolase (beta-lactamase superfamily II)
MVVEVPDTMGDVDAVAPLRFAGAEWHVVHTPGHSPGHITLHARARGWLIAGDHLLETISPAVGLYPEGRDDPLADYLTSLRLTKELDVRLVLPGHREPFTAAAERIDALLAHHESRLKACLDAVGSGPATAWEVSLNVFGTQPDAANARFAQAEALAHLEYARLSRALLDRQRHADGIWFYSPC